MDSIRPKTTHISNGYYKKYPSSARSGFECELFAYTELSEFTPRLIDHGDLWILVEGCTPLVYYRPEDSFWLVDRLKNLYQRLHDAGYWHRDCAVVNVVVHPERGPLLIDFEHLTSAVSDVSYDLQGPAAAGVLPAWGGDWGDMWWGSEESHWSPRMWWDRQWKL